MWQQIWQFIEKNNFIIGALTGSLAAYLLGLVVNYFKRKKKIITYSIENHIIAESGHKELKIEYKGQLIERLYSHQAIIINDGNRPLKNIQIQITCDGGTFVEEKIIKSPRGVNYVTSRENQDEKIVIKCDLINKSETFTVGLTSINGKSENIYIVTREENLICKEKVPMFSVSATLNKR